MNETFSSTGEEKRVPQRTLVLTDEVSDSFETADVGFFTLGHLTEEVLGQVVDVDLRCRERLENGVAVHYSGELGLAPSLATNNANRSLVSRVPRRREGHTTYNSHFEIWRTISARVVPFASAAATTSIVCQMGPCFHVLRIASAAGVCCFKISWNPAGLDGIGLIV